MCHLIEADFILIHVLKNNSSISIKDLVEKKGLIEKRFPNVYVDVSKPSIINSINTYPKVFSWENNIIRRGENSIYFEAPIIDYFRNNLETNLAHNIAELLETNEK